MHCLSHEPAAHPAAQENITSQGCGALAKLATSCLSVLVHTLSELVAPQRTTSAPSELVAPQRTTSAPERIRSAPRDHGPSDEDVIVVNSDDTTLTLSHDHSLLTASSCAKLASARMQCSLRAASYMYAVHIVVDQHALLVA